MLVLFSLSRTLTWKIVRCGILRLTKQQGHTPYYFCLYIRTHLVSQQYYYGTGILYHGTTFTTAAMLKWVPGIIGFSPPYCAVSADGTMWLCARDKPQEKQKGATINYTPILDVLHNMPGTWLNRHFAVSLSIKRSQQHASIDRSMLPMVDVRGREGAEKRHRVGTDRPRTEPAPAVRKCPCSYTHGLDRYILPGST